MKKIIIISLIFLSLAFNCIVNAQEVDTNKEESRCLTNYDLPYESYLSDKVNYNQRNQISTSVGTCLLMHSFKYNYRRSLEQNKILDFGVNIGAGFHYIPSLFGYDDGCLFISPSLSLAIGKYDCFQIDLGGEYLIRDAYDKQGSDIIPYINAFYVSKSESSNFIMKIGGGFPFCAHMAMGFRI